jgi:hypothetical protein
LIITDHESNNIQAPEAWVMRIIAERDVQSYLGPFVMNRQHPLTEGLSLGGVIWGAGKSEQAAGLPIITAGNVPLLTDVEYSTGRHDVWLRFDPDRSTLQDSPNWPALLWNLMDWRAFQSPGFRQTNVRLGADAAMKVDPGTTSIRLVEPTGRAIEVPLRDTTTLIKAEQTGVYQVISNTAKYSFAANALSQEESDLTPCASGRWGSWETSESLQREFRSIAWALLLAALAVMTAHLAVIGHQRK